MSDPIPPPAWWQRRSDQDRNSSYDMSSGILATGLISLALVVAVLVFLHLYVRYVLRRRYPHGGGRRSLTTAMDLFRFNTAVDQPPAGAGLDPAAISALPSFPYRKTNDEEEEDASGVGGPECAVCLSAVEEGEMVRRLPACKHVFHVGCIDMWLASHVTCPVCRATVEPTPADSAVVEIGEPSRPAAAAAAAKWASQEGPSGTKEGGSASFSFDLSASLKRMVSRSRSSSSQRVQEETTEDLPQEGPSRTKEGGSASFNFDLSASLKRMVSRNRSSSSQQAQEETTEDLPQEGPSETKEGASPSFRFDLSASLKRMVSRSRSSSSQQVQEETTEDVPPNLERL